MLRCEFQRLSEKTYRINFAFKPDAPTISEVWEKDGKEIRIRITSPWACQNEEEEQEWRWCEYEKKYIEEFLEWLGFKPLEEED